MANHVKSVVALTLVTWLSVGSALPLGSTCKDNQNEGIAFYTDPKDCMWFYMCNGKKVAGTFSCGPNMAFNSNINTCLPRNAAAEFCAPVADTPVGPCADNTAQRAYITSLSDCNTFHLCHGTVLKATFRCKAGDIFNDKIRACVTRGTNLDICKLKPDAIKESTKAPPPMSPTKPCSHQSTGKYKHPSNCGRYYDCAQTREWFLPGDNEHECQFPNLYDVTSSTCKHYSMVACGDRWEPKGACDYQRNQCQRAHCIPCDVRFGSCTGLTDGFQPWKGKLNTPAYVECVDGRVANELTCPVNSSGRQLIFHPTEKYCA